MLRKTFFYALYIFAATCCVLITLEVALQLQVRIFRPDILELEKKFIDSAEKLKLYENWKYTFKKSPFFGYVNKWGNNYGFSAEEDFPLVKNENNYYIHILGGSVAGHLAAYINKNPEYVEQIKNAIPGLKNKNVKFINMAIPGYKQPQQYIVLSYFIEQVDFVIQVDGWNEAAFMVPSEFPLTYPSFSEVLFTANGEKEVVHLENLKRMGESLSSYRILKNSMTVFLIYKAITKYIYKKIEELSDKDKNFYNRVISVDEKKSIISSNWIKYLKLERILLQNYKIPSLFFIQPSQYNENSKKFSWEEKHSAFIDYGDSVKTFQAIRELGKQNDVYDLVNVFSNERETIYVDDCCHVNDLGNKIMAQEIMLQLIKKLSK